MNFKTIALIIILGIIIIISVQNTQIISLKILFWEFNFPLIVLLFIIILISFIAGKLHTKIKKIINNIK